MMPPSLIDQLLFHAYRWSGYVVLNLIDDAAILAIVFC